MVPVRLSIEINDTVPCAAIDTELPVRPKQGDVVKLWGIEDRFNDDDIAGLAAAINEFPEAQKVIGKIGNKGPVENYKAEVLGFLEFSAWRVENVMLSPKFLFVSLIFYC